MNIFDQLYCLAFRLYKRWGDADADIISVNVVALIQGFNVFSLFFLFELLNIDILSLNKIYVVSISILLLVINYFRYFKIKPISDIEKYIAEHPEMEKRKVFILIYFWSSIAIFFGLAITGAIING